MTFDDWSDDDGTISIYSTGPTGGYKITGLRINAKSSQCFVTYDPNGSTSGSVPTDANEYDRTDTVTVLGNTGSLVKTGYTWGGWNTAANGSGINYSSGDTLK